MHPFRPKILLETQTESGKKSWVKNQFSQDNWLASVAAILIGLTCTAVAQNASKPSGESTNPRAVQADAVIKRSDDEAFKVYALAKIKIRQRAIADLKEAQATATRTNKLDDAVEIRNKIDQLELEMNDAVSSVAAINGSENPAKKAILGKWQLLNDPHVYEFLSGGKFQTTLKGQPESKGSWDFGDNWLMVTCDSWVKWGPVKDGKWNMTCAIISQENSGPMTFTPSKNGQATKPSDIDYHPFGLPMK